MKLVSITFHIQTFMSGGILLIFTSTTPHKPKNDAPSYVNLPPTSWVMRASHWDKLTTHKNSFNEIPKYTNWATSHLKLGKPKGNGEIYIMPNGVHRIIIDITRYSRLLRIFSL